MDTLKGTPLKKLGGFTESDSQIQFLENLFNEDCKCQASHKRHCDSGLCSHEVTYSAQSCNLPQIPVCEESASASIKYIASGKNCGRCGRPASECWIITPI